MRAPCAAISAVADTNDAQLYHDFALDAFERDPGASAAAFYWAARINPNMASAFYGRRAALILGNRGLLKSYMTGSRRRNPSKEMLAVDSLYLRALMINPFLYTQLDRRMFKDYIRTSVVESSRRDGRAEPSEGELNFFIEQWMRDSGQEMRGWLEYGDGNFENALKWYGEALKGAKFKAGLRIERARIFGMRGGLDSAVKEFKLALEEMRQRDAKDLVIFYNSKAVLEHSIGTLLEQADDIPGAREAYGRALQEDLSYYPAHVRLGLLAVDAGDTATAMSELDLATQIASDEPYVRFVHGFALAKFGKLPEAIVQLAKAVELEPYYAQPYALLGRLLEHQGNGPGALTAYESYLARASQRDAEREAMTKRLAALREQMGIEVKPK
jgi:tetratricopeptide (TPR) repeat protein